MTGFGPGTRRAARLLRAITFAGTVLIALACGLGSYALASGQARLGPFAVELDEGLSALQGAGLLLAAGLLLIIALFRLMTMLRRVEAGESFPSAPLRGFALYVLLALFVSVAGPPLIQLASAVITGSGRIQLNLDGGQLVLLFVASLFFFVARLFDDAQAIADDASQIV